MKTDHCTACPRRCGAKRTETGNKGGFCGMPAAYSLARAALHFWEEPCLSGTEGSGTVFFTGCSLQCVYCQNYEISTKRTGMEVSERRLMEIFEELIHQGANNINLVNPTHYAPMLAKTLRKFACPVPVVYNSSGYERVETLRLLEGLVDVYLPDLKYCSDEKSLRYSGVADYFDVATAAIQEMVRQVGAPIYDEKGHMKKGVLVRHLILPGNTNSSIRLLDWIHENLPPEIPLSLMSQYTPCGRAAEFPELARRLTLREYEKVVGHLLELHMENGFLQELSCAKEEYIPPFDFTGVQKSSASD